jgi:rRNA-processing protein EBP2
MARSKLLTALDAQKGRDHRLEHQKKLRKAAEKRKSAKRQRVDKDGSDEEELDSDHVGVAATSKVNGKQVGALIE